MQIPVLIEPLPTSGFRATAGEPLRLSAEGATREEALQELRELMNGRLKNGAQLVTLAMPSNENPWMKYAGMFKDDPDFAEVIEIMAENRRKMDEDPDVP